MVQKGVRASQHYGSSVWDSMKSHRVSNTTRGDLYCGPCPSCLSKNDSPYFNSVYGSELHFWKFKADESLVETAIA